VNAGPPSSSETRPRRLLLIVNEGSRSGGPGTGQTAEDLLTNGGFHVIRDRSNGPDDLDRLVRRHAPNVDAVVLGGGDGTFNHAAKALMDCKLPLGILPLGTGNDLARTLGLPMDLPGAVNVILEGATQAIDLGDVNGRPFFNVASLGLSAGLTRNLTSDVKRRWGRFGYAVALFHTLVRARRFSAVIRANGHVHRVRTFQIAVGNGRHYGAGMTVEEDARIDDGTLNVYSLEFADPWGLLWIYPAFRKGTHGVWREVRTFKCESVEIHTRRPRSINTDGEITTHTPAVFKVLHGAVQVFVPPVPKLL